MEPKTINPTDFFSELEGRSSTAISNKELPYNFDPGVG